MAAQTKSALADVLKEVFTDAALNKQFYDVPDWLNDVQKTNKHTIGNKAVVPIHKGRAGGFGVQTGDSTAAINAANAQKVDRAEYTVPYFTHNVQVSIGAYNEAAGGDYAAVSAIVLEVEGGLSDIRHQVEAQFLGDGSGLIAKCTTTSNSTTVLLDPAGYGYDAIVRGWLVAGQTIDIGTTSSEAAVVGDATIVSVVKSSSAPAIVIDSAVTTSSSHYVSIANSRTGSTSLNANGLRTIAGTADSAIGTLDPDNSGEEFWAPASIGTETTLSLSGLMNLQRATHQNTGKKSTFILTSLKQKQALYEQLQSQVRFNADAVSAGDVDRTSWNGNQIEAIPAVPDRELYVLNLEDLIQIQGAKISGPTFMSSLTGAGNKGMVWKQQYLQMVDTIVYPVNLGCKRRNGFAANISLTD